MKERPIIFNAEMVHAVVDGCKTQTRRPLKGSDFAKLMHAEEGDSVWLMDAITCCPFGQKGDRLWVREKFQFYSPSGTDDGQITFNNITNNQYWQVGPLSGDVPDKGLPSYFKLVDKSHKGHGKTINIPSIHMPRWASRILLEITSIRVERVQDISTSDALAEGVNHKTMNCPRHEFFQLWNSIYGAMAHDRNDWVWVIEFKRIEPEQ